MCFCVMAVFCRGYVSVCHGRCTCTTVLTVCFVFCLWYYVRVVVLRVWACSCVHVFRFVFVYVCVVGVSRCVCVSSCFVLPALAYTSQPHDKLHGRGSGVSFFPSHFSSFLFLYSSALSVFPSFCLVSCFLFVVFKCEMGVCRFVCARRLCACLASGGAASAVAWHL